MLFRRRTSRKDRMVTAASRLLPSRRTVAAATAWIVGGAAALTAAIRSKSPGDKVQVTVTRGGSDQTVEVTLGELPQ